MSVGVAICEAVRDALNAHSSFSHSFEARIHLVPVMLDARELEDVQVVVVPGPLSVSRTTRGGTDRHAYEVGVGVWRRVGCDEDCEDMLDLLEEIVDFLRDPDQATMGAGSLQELRREWDPDAAYQANRFDAQVLLTYLVGR